MSGGIKKLSDLARRIDLEQVIENPYGYKEVRYEGEKNLTGTNGALEIRFFDQYSYNGPQTEDFLKRAESLYQAAVKLAGENASSTLKKYLLKRLSLMHDLIKSEYQLDIQQIQDPEKGPEYFAKIQKALKADLRQYVYDMLAAINYPQDFDLDEQLAALAQAESYHVAETGRANLLHIYTIDAIGVEGHERFSAARTVGDHTHPSTLRDDSFINNDKLGDTGQLSNFVEQTVGYRDDEGNLIPEFTGYRHSSYPPLKTADKIHRRALASQAAFQMITELAQQAYAKNPDAEQPLNISLSSLILLTPTPNDKRFMGNESETRQVKETLLALNMFNQRELEIEIDGKKVKVIPNLSQMNVPSNGFGEVYDALEFTEKFNNAINAKGFSEYQQRFINFIDEQLKDTEKTGVIHAEFIHIKNSLARLIGQYEDNSELKGLKQKLAAKQLKLNIPEKYTELEKIQQEYSDEWMKFQSSPKLGKLKQLYNAKLKEIREAEAKLNKIYKKIAETEKVIWELQYAEFIPALLADVVKLLQNPRFAQTESPHPARKFLETVQLYLESEKIFYSKDYTSDEHGYQFQVRYLIANQFMNENVEWFCKSGEDRTGMLAIMIEQFLACRKETGYFPQFNASNNRELEQEIMQQVHTGSVAKEITSQNAPGAKGLQGSNAYAKNADIQVGDFDHLNAALAKAVYAKPSVLPKVLHPLHDLSLLSLDDLDDDPSAEELPIDHSGNDFEFNWNSAVNLSSESENESALDLQLDYSEDESESGPEQDNSLMLTDFDGREVNLLPKGFNNRYANTKPSKKEVARAEIEEEFKKDATEWRDYLIYSRGRPLYAPGIPKQNQDIAKKRKDIVKRYLSVLKHGGLEYTTLDAPGEYKDVAESELTLAATISHGSRIIITVPKSENESDDHDAFFHWVVGGKENISDQDNGDAAALDGKGKPVFRRGFATHDVEFDENGGIKEIKLYPSHFRDWPNFAKNYKEGRHYGMNVGIGNDKEDGTNGHMYIYWSAPTVDKPGVLMVGFENAAPGETNSRSGAKHDASGQPAMQSLTEGSKFTNPKFKTAGIAVPTPYDGLRVTLTQQKIATIKGNDYSVIEKGNPLSKDLGNRFSSSANASYIIQTQVVTHTPQTAAQKQAAMAELEKVSLRDVFKIEEAIQNNLSDIVRQIDLSKKSSAQINKLMADTNSDTRKELAKKLPIFIAQKQKHYAELQNFIAKAEIKKEELENLILEFDLEQQEARELKNYDEYNRVIGRILQNKQIIATKCIELNEQIANCQQALDTLKNQHLLAQQKWLYQYNLGTSLWDSFLDVVGVSPWSEIQKQFNNIQKQVAGLKARLNKPKFDFLEPDVLEENSKKEFEKKLLNTLSQLIMECELIRWSLPRSDMNYGNNYGVAQSKVDEALRLQEQLRKMIVWLEQEYNQRKSNVITAQPGNQILPANDWYGHALSPQNSHNLQPGINGTFSRAHKQGEAALHIIPAYTNSAEVQSANVNIPTTAKSTSYLEDITKKLLPSPNPSMPKKRRRLPMPPPDLTKEGWRIDNRGGVHYFPEHNRTNKEPSVAYVVEQAVSTYKTNEFNVSGTDQKLVSQACIYLSAQNRKAIVNGKPFEPSILQRLEIFKLKFTNTKPAAVESAEQPSLQHLPRLVHH